MKTVIIGSGIAGLTAGAYLARAGHEVIVYEQFATPGGVTATLRQDGFAWDIGPLLLDGFAPGDKGRIVLEELGVSDKVKMIREDRGLVMRDIALWKPEVYAGPNWRRERLKQVFPGESAHLDGYYRFYDRMLALMDVETPREPVGEGPLSFRVAAAVDFGAPLKQELLESRSEEQRLETLLTVMTSLLPRLELRKEREEAIRGNGKGY